MSQFRVDIYNAAGQKQGRYTQAVSNVRITDRINQIGECEFTVPAVVAAELSFARGLKYQIYHEELGNLGRYTHYDDTTDADQRTVTVKAYDTLVDLANQTAGFGRYYINQGYSAIVAALLNSIGLTATYETGFDQTQFLPSLEFQGESYLRALDVLRQYVRGFFRRDSDTVLHFGDFSATIPAFRLANPALSFADVSGDYASITALRRERRGTGVVNRVIPFGAGVGETVVDLRYSSRSTPYTIQHGTFSFPGSDTYYIADIPSLSAYGISDRVLNFTEVRPITNSAADLENAANAIYDLSVAYLQKNKDPVDVYSVSCVNLPLSVKVGNLIRVDYRGIATLEDETVSWMSLTNQKFFITELTRDFGESGNPTAQLTMSTNGEEIVGTTEVFSSLIGDVGNLKLRVQPSMSLYNKASATLPIAPSRPIDFTFYIGAEVLQINELKVEFTTMPLRSPVSVTSTQTQDIATTSTDPGSVPTSSTAPASTPTSASNNTTHTHPIQVRGTATGGAKPLYIDGGLNLTTNDGSGNVTTATSSETVTHTHTVQIPSHSHTIQLPSHSHTVQIPSHSHSLTFGVIDDSQTPSGVTVKVNGDFVGNIIDASTGVDQGSAVTGAGLWIVDILPTLLAQGDFRNKTHTIQFNAVGNRGQLFANVIGRMTIQSIATS